MSGMQTPVRRVSEDGLLVPPNISWPTSATSSGYSTPASVSAKLAYPNVTRSGALMKTARKSGYLEISDYAIIGNLRTAAMVSRDASIDSFCYPYFDSPSIFARILDKDIGGHFSIQPTAADAHTKQSYLPNSAIIVTKFLADEGVCSITDFMPRPSTTTKGDKPLLPWIIRRVEVIRGKLDFRLECFPGFDYARKSHKTHLTDDDNCMMDQNTNLPRQKAVFSCEDMTLELRAVTGCNDNLAIKEGEPRYPTVEFRLDKTTWPGHKGPGIVADFTLAEGQTVDFVLREDPQTVGMIAGVPQSKLSFVNKAPVQDRDGARVISKLFNLKDIDPYLDTDAITKIQESTGLYWYTWVQQSRYTGRWREFVHRSAITLKLLTFELTGAIVAAPTFSLPEGTNGEGRNWDYRFSWIRDASFTVYALIRLGFKAEATAYMEFMQSRIEASDPSKPLQIVFGIRGETDLTEIELPHLEGYKGQRPVRIGNGAADHLQLDVYGEFMDAVYLSSKLAKPCSWDLWCAVRKLVDYVAAHYQEADMSIWEVRNAKQNFVYSKVMMWVALDRGLRLADKRSLPCPQRKVWEDARNNLYEDIMEKGWNAEKGFFCQSYENKDALDASVLVMRRCTFESTEVDPRFLSTLKTILKTPERGGLTANSLVYRYDTSKTDDGVGGEEGAFLLCACWAVEALTRAGQHDAELLRKARIQFEDLMGYANHVGLFSEEISKDGSSLGNMPQAFTHIAIISAAFNLNRVLGNMPVGL